MLTVKINTRKWVRAGVPKIKEEAYLFLGSSKLINENGNMCCLGFACLEMGFTEQEINRVGGPSGILTRSVANQDEELFRKAVSLLEKHGLISKAEGDNYRNSAIGLDLMSMNDGSAVDDLPRAESDIETQARIKSLGRDIGIDFVFEGPTLEEMIEEKRVRMAAASTDDRLN
jgi:hypothetical protein